MRFGSGARGPRGGGSLERGHREASLWRRQSETSARAGAPCVCARVPSREVGGPPRVGEGGLPEGAGLLSLRLPRALTALTR